MGRGAQSVAGRREGVPFLDPAGIIAGVIFHSVSLAKDIGNVPSSLPGNGIVLCARPWAALHDIWSLPPGHERSSGKLFWPLHRDGRRSIEKGGAGPYAMVDRLSQPAGWPTARWTAGNFWGFMGNDGSDGGA